MVTKERIAALYGCTIEQVVTQAAKNIKSMEKLLDKAQATGKKVNGYTEFQLIHHISNMTHIYLVD